MVHFQSPDLWWEVQQPWESYSRVLMGIITPKRGTQEGRTPELSMFSAPRTVIFPGSSLCHGMDVFKIALGFLIPDLYYWRQRKTDPSEEWGWSCADSTGANMRSNKPDSLKRQQRKHTSIFQTKGLLPCTHTTAAPLSFPLGMWQANVSHSQRHWDLKKSDASS